MRENVVPLINVVFLLLVFFMLTATLRPAGILDVRPPETEAPADPAPPDWPVLAVDAEGRLASAGRRVERDALAHLGPRIRLRADAGLPARLLLPLLEALDRAGVEELEVVARVP